MSNPDFLNRSRPQPRMRVLSGGGEITVSPDDSFLTIYETDGSEMANHGGLPKHGYDYGTHTDEETGGRYFFGLTPAVRDAMIERGWPFREADVVDVNALLVHAAYLRFDGAVEGRHYPPAATPATLLQTSVQLGLQSLQ